MMKQVLKITGISAAGAFMAMAVLGGKYGVGPFGKMREKRLASLPGNDEKYAPENLKENPDSPLKGKHICFLGSSVTYGAGALGTSFVEDLARKDGITYVKEAVNGTTLCDNGPFSYVQRMLHNVSKDEKFDLVVIQLSTNDARKNVPLGSVSDSMEPDSFERKTTIGAMEFLIAYVRKTYHCPILFYTGTWFESNRYEQMVKALEKLQRKWKIDVLDFWDDPKMRCVSEKDYSLYMSDPIHPTRAGYAIWWLPGFEKAIEESLKEKESEK